MITHPDHSLTNLTTDYPDIISSAKNDPIESELDRLLSTPERSYKTLPKESSVLFHSLPPTPQQLPNVASHSISAPGTPGHREHNDPPPVHRFPIVNSKLSDAYQSSILNAPSAFDPINVNKNSRVGVIGSRPNKDSVAESPIIPYNNESSWGFADPRLAPGNGAVRSAASSLPNNITPQLSNPLKPQSRHPVMQSTPSHAPQSQQQQLLHAQRMAQIQQAQLHQQQKLQQIVQQANQQKIKQTEQDKHFPVGQSLFLILIYFEIDFFFKYFFNAFLIAYKISLTFVNICIIAVFTRTKINSNHFETSNIYLTKCAFKLSFCKDCLNFLPKIKVLFLCYFYKGQRSIVIQYRI